jgi:organic hydroperoxide reductase OsmC/OhrA
MAIAPFPHRYIVSLANDQLHALPRAPVHIGPPPQFGGTDSVWGPEDLLVGAAIACLKTTFDAFARRDGLRFRDWTASGTGVLEKGASGPRFSEITIHVAFAVDEGHEEDARRVLAVSERQCIISRTLTCPVAIELTLQGRDVA